MKESVGAGDFFTFWRGVISSAVTVVLKRHLKRKSSERKFVKAAYGAPVSQVGR